MELRLQKPEFWASLHLRSGRFDWDMSREMGLPCASDQVSQGATETTPSSRAPSESLDAMAAASLLKPLLLPLPPGTPPECDLQPNLWMWVDPNLVCPVPGRASAVDPLAGSFTGSGLVASSSSMSCLGEDQLLPSHEVEKALQADPAPLQDSELPQKVRTPHLPWKTKVLRSRSRRLKRTPGGWPRPPLNYCILISLALSSSEDSSLTVQEIYRFTRQHFPFFRTAPEGWKNTIRHNLCFSSSFEKTTDFVCLEGNRKSRLWKLTTEGRRKFQTETQALPKDLMELVHQSMDKPELMRSLFGF